MRTSDIILQARSHGEAMPADSTQIPLDEQTKKLFKAVNDVSLEDFEEALREGASVNAFDSGNTPLMTIVVSLSTCSDPAIEKKYYSIIRSLLLHDDIGVNVYDNANFNIALHLAMCFQLKKAVQLLLSHPNVNTSLINKDAYTPEIFAKEHHAEHLIPEIQKAKKGKLLLSGLSAKNITYAAVLLNQGQEFNPNCWSKDQLGEIETPLSLVIKSCLQGITQDKKDVLVKLLKHEELDFSQVKPIHDIKHNLALKQIIKQALKERLVPAIDSKDLNNVKKLVEENYLMNHAIVIDALHSADNVTEPIKDYLNTEASNMIQSSIDELTSSNRQLLDNNTQLRTQIRDLSNENKKLSEASTQSRKQGNYASIFCGLAGVSVVGACLGPLLAICIPLALAAFIFLGTGCYYSYKANTALEDVTSNQLMGNASHINT